MTILDSRRLAESVASRVAGRSPLHAAARGLLPPTAQRPDPESPRWFLHHVVTPTRGFETVVERLKRSGAIHAAHASRSMPIELLADVSSYFVVYGDAHEEAISAVLRDALLEWRSAIAALRERVNEARVAPSIPFLKLLTPTIPACGIETLEIPEREFVSDGTDRVVRVHLLYRPFFAWPRLDRPGPFGWFQGRGRVHGDGDARVEFPQIAPPRSFANVRGTSARG